MRRCASRHQHPASQWVDRFAECLGLGVALHSRNFPLCSHKAFPPVAHAPPCSADSFRPVAQSLLCSAAGLFAFTARATARRAFPRQSDSKAAYGRCSWRGGDSIARSNASGSAIRSHYEIDPSVDVTPKRGVSRSWLQGDLQGGADPRVSLPCATRSANFANLRCRPSVDATPRVQ